MKSITLFFLGFGSKFMTVSAQAKSCYYPDGTLSGDTPCNTTTTGHTSCCTDPCMSSGLCFGHGIISRGSCTDPTWKDSACPAYCSDYNPGGGCPIIPRQWSDISTGEAAWCCDFPIANGSCAQGIEIKVQAGTVLPNSTTTSTASSSSIASTASTSSTPSNTVTKNTCEANHEAAVGAGIGIPLGIAVVSLLLLWLREKRIRQKERPEWTLQAPQELIIPKGQRSELDVTPSELGQPRSWGELP